jgi:hypothetical protein
LPASSTRPALGIEKCIAPTALEKDENEDGKKRTCVTRLGTGLKTSWM